MAEIIIISENDVREFYPQLSANIDPKKIDASTLKAQRTDLERFLGYYLYNTFIEDYKSAGEFTTTIYQTLYDGETYSYKGNNRYFRGVRHLLSVYSFARIMGISDINVTTSGMVNKVTEESELRENSEQRYDIMMVKDDYIGLEKNVLDYILTKIEDYKLYHKRYSTDDYKTSFDFTRI